MTATELLTFDPVAARQSSFRFDLLDNTNAKVGTVTVDEDHAPHITNDTESTIIRKLDGLRIHPSDLNDINVLTDRIMPWHILGAGGTGYEFPLGIFLFADEDTTVYSYGSVRDGSLVDQGLVLEQTLAQSVSVGSGADVPGEVHTQATEIGIQSVEVEGSGGGGAPPSVGAAVVGVSGQDSLGKVLRDLAAATGYLRPYFNNEGTLISRPAPNLTAGATPAFAYGIGTGTSGQVIAGSVHQANGLLDAPNVYIVRDTSVREAEVVGRFDVPDSAPHSVANRGREIVRVENLQGLVDTTAANAAAAALYAQDGSVFASTSFETPIDSRHDTFDIVSFDGDMHIEHVWTMTLAPGGTMSHDIRRLYV